MRESSVSLPVTRRVRSWPCSTVESPLRRSRRRGARSRPRRARRARRWLVGERPVLGAGEREEALQQPVDVVELRGGAGRRACTDVRGHRPGFGHRDVERGAHLAERGAQLVRGVGDELALASNAASSRSSSWSNVSASSLSSSRGPRSAAARAGSCRRSARVGRRDRPQRRSTRPATSQPSTTETTAMIASATPYPTSSRCRSTERCLESASANRTMAGFGGLPYTGKFGLAGSTRTCTW